MALSNWLTRGEWNAAYLLYFSLADLAGDQPEKLPYPVDLSTHLRLGICFLDMCGYKSWTGIVVPDNNDPNSVRKDERSKYRASAVVAEGDNSRCLLELLDGTFDFRARARETRVWLAAHPEVDAPSLRMILDWILASESGSGDGAAT